LGVPRGTFVQTRFWWNTSLIVCAVFEYCGVPRGTLISSLFYNTQLLIPPIIPFKDVTDGYSPFNKTKCKYKATDKTS